MENCQNNINISSKYQISHSSHVGLSIILMIPIIYQSLSINDCLLHQINIINDCHLLVLVQVQRWLQLLLAFPSMSFGRRLICKRGSRFWRSGSLVACKHCCFEPSRVETWNVHYGCAEHSDLEPLMALWLKLWWWWVKGNVFRRGGFF